VMGAPYLDLHRHDLAGLERLRVLERMPRLEFAVMLMRLVDLGLGRQGGCSECQTTEILDEEGPGGRRFQRALLMPAEVLASYLTALEDPAVKAVAARYPGRPGL